MLTLVRVLVKSNETISCLTTTRLYLFTVRVLRKTMRLISKTELKRWFRKRLLILISGEIQLLQLDQSLV